MKTKEWLPVAQISTHMLDRMHGQGMLQDDEGRLFAETWLDPSVAYDLDDLYHTVTAGEQYRLDLISFKYYGTPLLGWVIMLANPDFQHPVRDIISGIVLRIPPLDQVYVKVLGQ